MTVPTRSELADRIAALEAVNAGTRLDTLEASEPAPVLTSTSSERLLEHAAKFEEAAADFRTASAALEPPLEPPP